MKKFLLIILLINIACICSAQCPFPVSITSSGNCIGDSLIANSGNPLSQIVWYNGSLPVKTISSANTMDVIVAGGNGAGTAQNQFIDPSSVFVDGSGNIYVTDRANNRVQKWAPGATTGVTVAGGNGLGSNPNQLNYPCATIVDGSGNVYVSDQNNQRIQKWAPGATNGVTVAGGNGYGNAANQFLQPWGIFIDRGGYLYVVDQGGDRVQKFPPGSTSATNGVTVAGGISGPISTQLANPVGIYVDASGTMYITDNGNSRVQKWAAGATTGITVAGGNGVGSNANQFNGCAGIYVDNSGNIYVADENNNRIQKWAPGATSGITVAGGKGYGSGSSNGELDQPIGIVVDGSDNMYISDYMNARILKWPQSLKIDSTYLPVTSGIYTAVVTDFNGCSVTTNPITINAGDPSFTTINASAKSICEGDSVTFTATTMNAGTSPSYQWKINNINAGNNDSVFVTSSLKNGDVITCFVSASVPCALPISSNNISIEVKPLPIISLVADKTILSGSSLQLPASVTGDISSYLWNPSTNINNPAIINPLASPIVNTVYTLNVTSTDGCVASKSIAINVSTSIKIIIPNAFSPNGDGINDTWNISNLADFPNCTVDVFNRNGQPVYHSEGYGKQWDGTYNNKPLPVGTYYYVINPKNNMQQLSGSVTILR